MKRILPKIIGLALVAGVASFVLAMIAKLLLAATFIGLVAFYVRSLFKSRNPYMQQGFSHPRFSQDYFQAEQSPFNKTNKMPFAHSQKSLGIVPIN